MSEKRIAYQGIKTVLNSIDGMNLKDHKGVFRFPMYLTEKTKETDIEALDLSVRSMNALKRAGFKTIGDVMEGIKGSADLRKIRNCGSKSVEEIMEKLFLFQFISLSEQRRISFISHIVELNKRYIDSEF